MSMETGAMVTVSAMLRVHRYRRGRNTRRIGWAGTRPDHDDAPPRCALAPVADELAGGAWMDYDGRPVVRDASFHIRGSCIAL